MTLWRTTNPKHPSLARYAERWAASLQNRAADAINDVFPYGLLTMIVSLEAIFLGTFVMISQNRADVKR